MNLAGLTERTPDSSMTFSSFIEGESNRLARAMALAASEYQDSYNLLYIYGGRGAGKSHLINAIANRLNERGINIMLTRGGAEAGLELELDLPPTVLLVDDFAFPDNELTGEIAEFIEMGGSLVLSGVAAPDVLPDCSIAGLIMEKGRSADIQLPEEELKVAILKEKAEAGGFDLPDDAAKFIAGHIMGNLHSLLGGLQRVRAMSYLSGQEITRFSAIEALKDYIWIG